MDSMDAIERGKMKPYISRTFLAAYFFIVLLSSLAFADDSIVADYGKTVSPKTTSEISMLKEEVVITLEDIHDKSAAFLLRRARVACTFLFKNESDKLIQTTVGFPGNEQDTAAEYSEPIKDFVTVIDGRKFNINIKKEVLKTYTDSDIQVFRNWYTWEMSFPAHSTVTVENSYNHILSTPSGYDPFILTYELSTGANWKGSIGGAIIRVIYKNDDDLEKRICEIKPKGWIRKKNEIIWTFTNIKPRKADNIFICERNLWSELPKENRKPLMFKK
jgi:Domain of unknown function (DUF4424)